MTAYRVQYQGFTGTITKSFDSQEQAETWVAVLPRNWLIG